jgi:hypothetical protein
VGSLQAILGDELGKLLDKLLSDDRNGPTVLPKGYTAEDLKAGEKRFEEARHQKTDWDTIKVGLFVGKLAKMSVTLMINQHFVGTAEGKALVLKYWDEMSFKAFFERTATMWCILDGGEKRETLMSRLFAVHMEEFKPDSGALSMTPVTAYLEAVDEMFMDPRHQEEAGLVDYWKDLQKRLNNGISSIDLEKRSAKTPNEVLKDEVIKLNCHTYAEWTIAVYAQATLTYEVALAAMKRGDTNIGGERAQAKRDSPKILAAIVSTPKYGGKATEQSVKKAGPVSVPRFREQGFKDTTTKKH